GGYTAGSGSRERTFGSLVVGYYKPGAAKLTYVGHAGSGFDDRTLQTLHARLKSLRTDESPFDDEVPKFGMWRRPGKAEGPVTWVKPDLVAQVKFAERTSDGILRAPVYMGLRDDKAARDVGEIEVVGPPALTPPGHTQAASESNELVDELQHHKGEKLMLKVEGQEIAFSNLNKVFWPAHGDQRALTKRDLVIYFAQVAPYLLPHLHDRPLTLVRFPNGIHGGHFYQKHWEQPLGSYVETVW